MAGDLIGKILENIGLRHPSRDEQIHRYLEKTTDITVSMSPASEAEPYSAACAVLERIQVTHNNALINNIQNAVVGRIDVAVALGDKLLDTFKQLRHQYENYDHLKLILLGNPGNAINLLCIPSGEREIQKWQKELVSNFLRKYQYDKVSHETLWSSGCHTGVASLILDISGTSS